MAVAPWAPQERENGARERGSRDPRRPARAPRAFADVRNESCESASFRCVSAIFQSQRLTRYTCYPSHGGPGLPFEIAVVSNTPLTPLKDLDDVALLFLTQIGYIPKGYDPKTDASSVRDSVPYRLFVECLLGRMDKGWTVEQLAAKLKTTKATIYRHINKLKDMDLLDEVNVNERGTVRKGYRIRYGNLSKAWNFVESNVEIAMENYRKTVDHIQKLAEQRR